MTGTDETACGDWTPQGREYRFAAMPPIGTGVPLTEAVNLSVLLRGTPTHAQFHVAGRQVVAVDRRELRDWLKGRDAAVVYRKSPLILRRHNGDVIWFQLEGYTGSMVVTGRAMHLWRHALRD